MRIGFIGLGTMGGPAALNLLKRGHQVQVCDLIRDNAEIHIESGAVWAPTPADATREADVVFTMVFGSRQIAEVLRGENGVLAAIGPGQVWVDMTTNQPALSRTPHWEQ